MRNIILLLVIILAIAGCQSSQTVTTTINEEELGRQAFDSGNYESALDYYNSWLAKYPESADVLFERGRVYNRLMKFDMALKDFEAALGLNPRELRAQVYRSGALISLKQNDLAKTALTNAMTDSKFAQLPVYEQFLAYYLDSMLKNMDGDYENSVISADQALKMYEISPEPLQKYGPAIYRLPLHQRAIGSYWLGYYKQAAQDMEQYIQLTQQVEGKVSPKHYKSLALALYMAEDFDKCKGVMAQLNPQDRQDFAGIFGDAEFFGQPPVANQKPTK